MNAANLGLLSLLWFGGGTAATGPILFSLDGLLRDQPAGHCRLMPDLKPPAPPKPLSASLRLETFGAEPPATWDTYDQRLKLQDQLVFEELWYRLNAGIKFRLLPDEDWSPIIGAAVGRANIWSGPLLKVSDLPGNCAPGSYICGRGRERELHNSYYVLMAGIELNSKNGRLLSFKLLAGPPFDGDWYIGGSFSFSLPN